MNYNIVFLLFIINIVSSLKYLPRICPSDCVCYSWMDLRRTDCVNKNLVNTNIGIPHVTKVLDLSHNVITILHGNEFQDANLRLLKILKLSNNLIQEINKLSFNGLKDLEVLDLAHNNIRHLEPDTFKYNPNLRELNISYNHLGVINRPLFTDVPTLQFLNMAHCSLLQLSNDLFQNMNYLQFLNISDNLIIKIDEEVLDPLTGLTDIDFSKNDITCNEDAKKLIKKLNETGINFRPFCEVKKMNKLIHKPILQEVEDLLPVEFLETTSSSTLSPNTQKPNKKDDIFRDIVNFFDMIPSFYAILCGLQLGFIFGSLFTYCSLRRKLKTAKQNSPPPVPLRTMSLQGNRTSFTERVSRIFERDNDDYQELMELGTPPDTPPSPYRSVIDS